MVTLPRKPISPKRWSLAELQADARSATRAFRNERLNEPLDLYNQSFNEFTSIFVTLIDQLPRIAKDPVNADLVAGVLDGKHRQKAFWLSHCATNIRRRSDDRRRRLAHAFKPTR